VISCSNSEDKIEPSRRHSILENSEAMTPPDDTAPPPTRRPGQDPLLDEARLASLEAAETAAAAPPAPLDWEALDRRRAARSRAAAWAAVLIPLLLVGGSAGTWAVVRHLRAAAPDPVPPVPRLPAHPAVVERPVQPPRRSVAPAPAEPAPPPRPAPRKRRATRAPGDAAPTASTADAGADQPPKKIVVLPGEVTGDDEVIIVTPKAKLKPLWTVEGFKRRGMRGFLKKVDPVKPAPEGIEHEIP
jgi:hypothetical protein